MSELEREAIGIYRQYRFLLPQRVREFLYRVAVQFEWSNLKNEMEK